MHYINGETVRLGDVISLYQDCKGTVVCDVDGDSYDDAFPKAEWGPVLRKGVLIHSNRAGLVHMTESDGDLKLIRRR